MEEKHLVTTCTLTMNNREIPLHALIDCGAMGIAFMDQDYACIHQIPLQVLRVKKRVKVIHARPIELGDITYIAKVGMKMQDHGEQLLMFVTKMGYYPIVLRIPWLQLHDVTVKFASKANTCG
jgi:hypothetical protein